MSAPYPDRLLRKRKAEQIECVNAGDFLDGRSNFAPSAQKRWKDALLQPLTFFSNWISNIYQGKPAESQRTTCSSSSYTSACAQTDEICELQNSAEASDQMLPKKRSDSVVLGVQEHVVRNHVESNAAETHRKYSLPHGQRDMRQRIWTDSRPSMLHHNGTTDVDLHDGASVQSIGKMVNGHLNAPTTRTGPVTNGSYTPLVNGSQVPRGLPLTMNQSSNSQSFRVPTPISTLVCVGAARGTGSQPYLTLNSRTKDSVLFNTFTPSQSGNRTASGSANLTSRDAAASRDRYTSERNRYAYLPFTGRSNDRMGDWGVASTSHSSAASVVTNANPIRLEERDKFRELLKRVTSADVHLASDAFVPQRGATSVTSSARRAPRYSFEATGFAAQMNSTAIANWSRASSVSTQVISSRSSSPAREANDSTLQGTDESTVQSAFRSRILASPYVNEAWLANLSLRDAQRVTLQHQIERERERQSETRRARETLRVACNGDLRQHSKAYDQEEAEEFAQRLEKVSMYLQEPPYIEEYEKLLKSTEQSGETDELVAEPIVDEFFALPENAELLIRQAFRGGPPDEMLVEGYRLQLKRADLMTLAGLSWLNDEVINFYMQMIMDRSEKANGSDKQNGSVHRKLPKVYSFNTFFYPKLMGGGHSALKRWTKKIDLFEYDIIIVPVHLQVHWCLAVIDLRFKIIRYYDSMGGPNPKALRALLDYLDAEHREKKQTQLDTSSWKLEHADVPQQQNGSDCGMFACKFADFAARDARIIFTQENMPYYRKRMVYEILTKRFLDES